MAALDRRLTKDVLEASGWKPLPGNGESTLGPVISGIQILVGNATDPPTVKAGCALAEALRDKKIDAVCLRDRNARPDEISIWIGLKP
jgi:hypothetical protein